MEQKNQTKNATDTNQEGAALVISIFAILLVTIIGFALISNGLLSQNIAANAREQTEAYYISEAGLTHASSVVKTAGHFQFNKILKAGDGKANTGDELSVLASIPATGVNFGSGKYIIYVSDDIESDGDPNTDSNERIVIRSVGIGQNGATVTTETIMSSSGGPAILVNGRLRISGNPSVLGTNGIVHANGILELAGNPCASLYFSASSNITNPNSGRGGADCTSAGTTRPNQPAITTPIFDVTSFKSKADYVLKTDGKIYNKSGNVIFDANFGNYTSGGVETSWNSTSRAWRQAGNGTLSGIYYSEGNMEISGNFGTSGSPVPATFIAEGYISVAGNVHIDPPEKYCGSGNCEENSSSGGSSSASDYSVENFTLMAGTDLRITGNFTTGTQSYQGINYAGHQVEITGTPDIYGIVIAANVADTNSPGCNCNQVPLTSNGSMEISGNPKFIYNGGVNSLTKSTSWREVRY